MSALHTGASLALLLVVLSACGDKGAPSAPAAAPPAPAAAATPAPAAAPAPAPVVAAPAPPVPTAPAAPRQVALAVQGVASAGLTVRVKAIEMGEDATILTVSASFGSRETNFTNLAETNTFLVDPAGNRLMLRPPEDNRYLRIVSGDTMEGKLVFLGAVAPGTPQLRLVINEGHTPEDTSGPGLSIALPLQPGGT